ncbi:hypothetical protein C8R44DRAFT_790759 [Mycena epipterygia]|nr:hypothetical protein C8R44DRAFT_790759 [Mycena epipterygia]
MYKVLLFYIFLTRVALCIANLSNRTIDDTRGDSETGLLPVYSPVANFSLNSNCSTCSIKLDPAQVFDGTWHDSSQLRDGPPVSITLSFNGTAIYVFCVLANAVEHTVTTSDFLFTLDGSARDTFTHEPSSSPDFIYQANVFSATGLKQGPHQVVLTTDNAAGSLLLFDFAIYTFDDGVSQTTSTVTETIAPSAAQSNTSRRIKQDSSTSLSPFSSSAVPGQDPSSTVDTPSPAPSSSISTPSPAPSSSISTTSPVQAASPPSALSSAARPKKPPILPIVLAATLAPLALILLAGVGIHRQHARYRKRVAETRVYPPEPEWVRFGDPAPQPVASGKAAAGLSPATANTARTEHHQAHVPKLPGFSFVNAPRIGAAPSGYQSDAVRALPGSSRANTVTAPPGYRSQVG